jgi:hypothetical protein
MVRRKDHRFAAVPVQFPDGPLRRKLGLLVERDDVWLATRKSGFNSPAVHSKHGLMVQRDDTRLAVWRSGFDSRWVH